MKKTSILISGWLALALFSGSIIAQENSPALLTTFKNPTRPAFTGFGTTITPVGNDRLLIGAPGAQDSGGLQTGVAYLVDTNGTLLTVVTNPTPDLYDGFGGFMTTVGSDRLLIGAPGDTTAGPSAGAAYLFDTNSTLLTTFTTPGASRFGTSMAALGNDRVLISALDSGAVYLFNTNGTLLNSFTGLTVGDWFGFQVAAMGTDRFVVTAPYGQQPASDAGSAYLFSVDGKLLTTFTNPVPQQFDGFGWSMAIVGTDRVLIGAFDVDAGTVLEAGVAYLFNTNGTLLTTFSNPAPIDSENFGGVVRAVADKILIGANGNASGLETVGIVYVFNTNGTLLTTITNPTPESYDEFGDQYSGMTTLGNNRVAIGALQDKSSGYEAGAVYLFTTDGGLLKTIFNPTPKPATFFGNATAALGVDRVLVGAPNENIIVNSIDTTHAGAAYLLAADGTFLSAFNNPNPAADDHFGISIAALGNDRVVIGSSKINTNDNALAGAAYLFNTNGALLATFINPFPDGGPAFAKSVAGLAGDRVIIGAPFAYVDAAGSGAAFLFDTNGTLITTVANPEPEAVPGFGWSVAALGNDRLLIANPFSDTGAAQSGSCYLFDTNQTLLATFTNPAPRAGDNFGYSLTTVGSDLVLIGSYNFGLGLSNAGAAYLFTTNGTLLTTYTNPVPTTHDHFGTMVAAVGNNRVLIGAQGAGTNGGSTGMAYLFSTNGALLAVFSNPSPEDYDAFGASVTAVGIDRVLIGTPGDDDGAVDSGTAYLFAIPYPTLSIAKTGAQVSLHWATPETGIVLQQTDQLSPAQWSDTTNAVSLIGMTNRVQQNLTPSNRFFRLHRP